MKLLATLLIFGIFTACTAPQTEENAAENATTSEATTPATDNSFINIDPATFAAKMEGNKGILLDVRTPEEIAEGKIAGAMEINYNDENFQEQLSQLDPATPVYVYCAAGGRSSKTAIVLKEKGFNLVYNLDGGITAWQEAGMPVEKK
jgi:rhodanese-related sulfurtransferase